MEIQSWSNRSWLTITTSISEVSLYPLRLTPGLVLNPNRPLPTILISPRTTPKWAPISSLNASHASGFGSKIYGGPSASRQGSSNSASLRCRRSSRNSTGVISGQEENTTVASREKFVDATPPAGWRVPHLSLGKVGPFFVRMIHRFRTNQSNRTQPLGPTHLAAAGRSGAVGAATFRAFRSPAHAPHPNRKNAGGAPARTTFETSTTQ